MKYLYGASVQGIQSFIFESNELSEIAGASEIVENICTLAFKKFIDIDDNNIIVAAAGNIRILADDKKTLEQLVLKFPKYVREQAPGITISQAVIEINNDLEKDDFIKLEKLLKIQRNKPTRPAFVSGTGIERSRKTGKPAVCRYKNELQDLSSKLKKEKSSSRKHSNLERKIVDHIQNVSFPYDHSEIVNKNITGWLAVIHADGNDLGKTIQTLQTEKGVKETFRSFSKKIEASTLKAAQIAFKKHIEPDKYYKKYYPFRPVIIGGDDLTVICRADLAIPFTKSFLENFEAETCKHFDFKITSCAGIAFVKEKYPFHYAVHLAEQLCAHAKKISKQKSTENELDYVVPSMMFHKITSSFVDSFQDIQQRELTAKASDVSFCYGPYSIQETSCVLPSVVQLYSSINDCNKDEFPVSGIRKWLSLLHSNGDAANQLWDRLLQIHPHYHQELNQLFYDRSKKTIAYDVLSILSLTRGGNE